MNNLSNTLIFEHRFADAEKLLRETLEIQRRVLGPEHPETVRFMVNLATSIVHQGRFDEAEKLERHALDIRRRVLHNHPDTALSLYNLAILQVRRRKPEEALKFLHEAVDHGLPGRTILGMEKDGFKRRSTEIGFCGLSEIWQREGCCANGKITFLGGCLRK